MANSLQPRGHWVKIAKGWRCKKGGQKTRIGRATWSRPPCLWDMVVQSLSALYYFGSPWIITENMYDPLLSSYHYIPVPPFHMGTAIRIQTRVQIWIDWDRPGCVHTGSKVAVVNNGIPECICINNDIATLACKMAAAAMIVIIFYFGLVSMMWLRQRRRIRQKKAYTS